MGSQPSKAVPRAYTPCSMDFDPEAHRVGAGEAWLFPILASRTQGSNRDSDPT